MRVHPVPTKWVSELFQRKEDTSQEAFTLLPEGLYHLPKRSLYQKVFMGDEL